MDAVIEIDEIGHVVHAGPLQRLACAVAFADRRQHRAVLPDLRMATHADLGRRETGESRLLDGCMTIPAIDAQPAHVMLVAEWDWLVAYHVGLGDVSRAADPVPGESDRGQDKHPAEDRHLRKRVRTG